jgi:hypothetical protein
MMIGVRVEIEDERDVRSVTVASFVVGMTTVSF